MEQQEQLQIIEDVCLSIRWYLQRYWMHDMDYGEAMFQIKKEMEKLECLELGKPKKPEFFMLTNPNFGNEAYLQKNNEQSWVVIVDSLEVTDTFTHPTSALRQYFNDSCEDDFIVDFLQGVDNGTCHYGDNKYAQYIQKCFDTYRIGREL